MLPLPYYHQKFSNLKLGHAKGVSAPHKPILLLAVILEIEAGNIKDNHIYITPELVSRFKDLFRLLGGSFTANFSLPFYHLKSSGFWHLHTVSGKEILLTKSLSIRSFAHLKEVVAFADFDKALFALLQQQESRRILQQALLDSYFGGRPITGAAQRGIFDEVKQQILNEPAAVYRRQVEAADEEELFVRGGVFKKVIPQVYNYTCSISGMRLIANRDMQMVDACHITPFSDSHDDTVSNGICLCPNLHRAFDRFLLSINAEGRVVVSENFIEETSTFAIRQFDGHLIRLPDQIQYHPAPANLAWHFEKFQAFQSVSQ